MSLWPDASVGAGGYRPGMSVDNRPAETPLPARCDQCAQLRQGLREYAGEERESPDRSYAPTHPRVRLARHVANHHLELVPAWTDECGQCNALRLTLLQAAQEGLLGAGAARAGAEHRAFHLFDS